jgi:hypothetical protein
MKDKALHTATAPAAPGITLARVMLQSSYNQRYFKLNQRVYIDASAHDGGGAADRVFPQA